MIWAISILAGLILAGLMSAFVFRTHPEMRWMKKGKACVKCEKPRSVLDAVPIVGDILVRARCKKCKSFVAWQYPVIEIIVVLLVVFNVWRYATGTWIGVTEELMLFMIRDIVFSLFLLMLFVFDMKYSLILDKISIPAMVIALIFNIALGISAFDLAVAMVILGLLFLVQYIVSNGRVMGAGDIRMGVVIGAMLGLAAGVGSVMLAYVLGAIVGGFLLLSKKHKLTDRVPFGTFLAVSTFMFLVWGHKILELFL